MNRTTRFGRVRLALGCGFVALLVLAFTPRADAGYYVVSNCGVQPGYPEAPDAQSLTNTSVFARTSDCSGAAGWDGLQIKNSGGVGGGHAYGAFGWTAPPGTSIQNVDFNFNIRNDNGHSASVTLATAGGALLGRWGPPAFPADGGWRVGTTVPTSAKFFTAWLECSGGCAASAQAHTFVKNLYFTIVDVTSPSLDSLGGSLLAGGTRRGTENLTVMGSDNASGISGAMVMINGVPVASPSAICAGLVPARPARSFYPCPSSTGWDLPINTELLPDGQNEVEVCVQDMSFDVNAMLRDCESRTIQVDNSCPNSGGAAATQIDAAIQAGTGSPRSAIVIRSDKPATIRGSLSGPANVAGSTVCLYEQVDLPGDGRELVDTGKVRNDGSFDLDVAPGPSRNLDVVYRNNNKIVERERLHVDAVVAPQFDVVGRAKLVNGQKVRFRGRIPGPNASGRGISLQARAGRKWRTFKQVRADPKGEFRGLYRFTQTTGRARYIFRARVKRQGDYPYLPGHSRERGVVVSG